MSYDISVKRNPIVNSSVHSKTDNFFTFKKINLFDIYKFRISL